MLKNSSSHYGLISVVLHWLIALETSWKRLTTYHHHSSCLSLWHTFIPSRNPSHYDSNTCTIYFHCLLYVFLSLLSNYYD